MQLAILLALFVRVILLEDEVTTARNTPQSAFPAESSDPSPAGRTITVAGLPDENRLRELIREELALQLSGLSVTGDDSEASTVASVYPGAEYEYRRESVAQSIDYYVSAGRITEVEMADLQQQIAGLNPDDRREMLGQLVRAMNNGALEGRL